MTYRITPQCGHPSLMGWLRDHGPGCLLTLTPTHEPEPLPVVTWAWAEGMTVETAHRVAYDMLATSRTKVTP